MRRQRLTQVMITGLLVSLGSLWSTHQALALPAPTLDRAVVAHKAPPIRHTSLLSPAPRAELMDNSPRFSGRASASVRALTVLLHDERGMLVQSLLTEPDESGRWEVEAALMGDGLYVATIKDAQDDHTLATLELTIDTFIPATFIQSHAPGARIDGLKAILGHIDEPDASLTVTVRDELGQLQDRQQPAINPQDGTWQVVPRLRAEGTYIIETTTQDRAGNKVTLARHFVQRLTTTLTPEPPTLEQVQEAADALVAQRPALDHAPSQGAPHHVTASVLALQAARRAQRAEPSQVEVELKAPTLQRKAPFIASMERRASLWRARSHGEAPRAGPLIEAVMINSAPSRAG